MDPINAIVLLPSVVAAGGTVWLARDRRRTKAPNPTETADRVRRVIATAPYHRLEARLRPKDEPAPDARKVVGAR